MKASVLVLTSFLLIISSQTAFGENADYLVDGLIYRGEGNCEESLKSYGMARDLNQFKEDWMYNLAVVDCQLGLKKLDAAIDSYTKIIESTSNLALQAEMYKGRARAYFIKSVNPTGIDARTMALSKNDLDNAAKLGADVSDISKDIKKETEIRRVENDGKTISSKQVIIIEGPGKMVVGDGEYVLYLSPDTKIKDQNGVEVQAADIKPGDMIDFSFNTSYLNKADGMIHMAANTVTLHRAVETKPEAQEKTQTQQPDTTQMLIISKLDALADEIRELKERLQPAPMEPRKSKVKRKSRKKSAAMDKRQSPSRKQAIPKTEKKAPLE